MHKFIFLTLFFATSNCLGAVTITALETDKGVMFTGSGSFNLARATRANEFVTTPFVAPHSGVFLGSNTTRSYRIHTVVNGSGPSSFGTTKSTWPSFEQGDGFGFGLNRAFVLAVPDGYTSEAPLNSLNFFADQTFESMGLFTGIYDWYWSTDFVGGVDTITLNIIPEPTTCTLALAALCLAMSRRRAF